MTALALWVLVGVIALLVAAGVVIVMAWGRLTDRKMDDEVFAGEEPATVRRLPEIDIPLYPKDEDEE